MRETGEITGEILVEENKAKQTAKRMLQRETSPEIIAEDTGLSLEQIQELRTETGK